jgi:hypothetical protein
MLVVVVGFGIGWKRRSEWVGVLWKGLAGSAQVSAVILKMLKILARA